MALFIWDVYLARLFGMSGEQLIDFTRLNVVMLHVIREYSQVWPPFTAAETADGLYF